MESHEVLSERRAVLRALASLAAWAAAPAALAQGGTTPAQFAGLSQALTTYAYQDPPLAAALVRALAAAIGAAKLTQLATVVTQAPGADLDAALEAAGLTVAAQNVIVALYSGMVDGANGARVLTYNEALAWQAVPWTKPNALCGGQTDYWSSAPSGQT